MVVTAEVSQAPHESRNRVLAETGFVKSRTDQVDSPQRSCGGGNVCDEGTTDHVSSPTNDQSQTDDAGAGEVGVSDGRHDMSESPGPGDSSVVFNIADYCKDKHITSVSNLHRSPYPFRDIDKSDPLNLRESLQNGFDGTVSSIHVVRWDLSSDDAPNSTRITCRLMIIDGQHRLYFMNVNLQNGVDLSLFENVSVVLYRRKDKRKLTRVEVLNLMAYLAGVNKTKPYDYRDTVYAVCSHAKLLMSDVATMENESSSSSKLRLLTLRLQNSNITRAQSRTMCTVYARLGLFLASHPIEFTNFYGVLCDKEIGATHFSEISIVSNGPAFFRLYVHAIKEHLLCRREGPMVVPQGKAKKVKRVKFGDFSKYAGTFCESLVTTYEKCVSAAKELDVTLPYLMEEIPVSTGANQKNLRESICSSFARFTKEKKSIESKLKQVDSLLRRARNAIQEGDVGVSEGLKVVGGKQQIVPEDSEGRQTTSQRMTRSAAKKKAAATVSSSEGSAGSSSEGSPDEDVVQKGRKNKKNTRKGGKKATTGSGEVLDFRFFDDNLTPLPKGFQDIVEEDSTKQQLSLPEARMFQVPSSYLNLKSIPNARDQLLEGIGMKRGSRAFELLHTNDIRRMSYALDMHAAASMHVKMKVSSRSRFLNSKLQKKDGDNVTVVETAKSVYEDCSASVGMYQAKAVELREVGYCMIEGFLEDSKFAESGMEEVGEGVPDVDVVLRFAKQKFESFVSSRSATRSDAEVIQKGGKSGAAAREDPKSSQPAVLDDWHRIINRSSQKDVHHDRQCRTRYQANNQLFTSKAEGDSEHAHVSRHKALLDTRIMLLACKLGILGDGIDCCGCPKVGSRVLVTPPGCEQQKLHTDYDVSKLPRGPHGGPPENPGYFALYTGEHGDFIVVIPRSHFVVAAVGEEFDSRVFGSYRQVTENIPPYSVCFIRADTIHAGCGNKPDGVARFRGHMYILLTGRVIPN